MFTVFGEYYFNADILKPADSLPLLIYSMSPHEDPQRIAWRVFRPGGETMEDTVLKTEEPSVWYGMVQSPKDVSL